LRSGKSDDGTRATMAERLKIVCSGMGPRTVVVWTKVFPRSLSFPRGFPRTIAPPARLCNTLCKSLGKALSVI
jgi:hypothetical protein